MTLPTVLSVKESVSRKYTKELQEAFPDCDPQMYPTGYIMCVQLRTPKRKSAGGLILTDDTRDAEKYRAQVGLVRALGPACFKRRDTLEAWPEGNWCNPGDFVRVPMYGMDRFVVPFGGGDNEAVFVFMKDSDVIAMVLGDPLAIKTS